MATKPPVTAKRAGKRNPRGRAKAQRDLLIQELDRLANRAANLGVESQELRKMLDESLARVEKQRAAHERSNP